MSARVAIAAALVALAGLARDARAEQRVATAIVTADAPRIDGRLDDAVWAEAPSHDGFRRQRPTHGGLAEDRTSFQLAFDDEALYVAVRAAQRGEVARQLSRRDQEPPSDWIRVAIDGAGEGRSALEFAVSAAGVQVDALWTDDAHRDLAWDAGWTAATRVDEAGWTAELRVPLAALRLPARPARVGLQLWRTVLGTGEESAWALAPADDPRVVGSFGRLAGAAPTGATHALTAVQHLLLENSHAEVGQGTSLRLAADLTWQPSRALVVNAAVYPDFGFVEADPALIDLGAAELFVEERRPLFNEGREIFDVPLGNGADTLLYSRRIGRPPRGAVDAPPGATVATPRVTDIIAALKLSGRPGAGVSYAALGALTAPARARIRSDDRLEEQVIEPLTHYGALRAVVGDPRRRLGLLLTSVTRLGDEVPALVDDALAGAIDGSLQVGARHQVDAVLLGSWLDGGPDAIEAIQRAPVHYLQRPDATHLMLTRQDSLAGYGARARGARVSGGVRYGVDAAVRSPGLDLGELGFLERADLARARGWISHHVVGQGALERLDTELSAATAATFGGETIERSLLLTTHAALRSRWTVDGGARLRLRALDTQVLRGGPALLVEPSLLAVVTVTSDARRRVGVGLTLRGASDGRRAWAARAVPEVTLRPWPRAQLALALNVSSSRLDHQFVAAGDPMTGVDVAVGTAWVASADATLRASYAVSRRLTVQGYAQLFASTADYGLLRRVVQPHASRYDDRYGVADGVAEPDFSASELHAIAAARWEASAGVTWSLLWSHDVAARADGAAARVWQPLDQLGTMRAEDVVILKVSGAYTL